MAQKAIEYHFEGQNWPIPTPSDIRDLENTGEYEGGVWLLIDLDLNRINTKPQRLNISLPSNFVQRMDEFAASQSLNRSALIQRATEAYMRVTK